jgi:hypothetical protein
MAKKRPTLTDHVTTQHAIVKNRRLQGIYTAPQSPVSFRCLYPPLLLSANDISGNKIGKNTQRLLISSFKTKFTIFLTTGTTSITVGKATTKAKPHAFSHIDSILFISPTLKILITSDMMQDINNAIKNANTTP